MKRVLWLLMVGVFVTSMGLVGCGYVKKDEFMPEYEKFKAENQDAHKQLGEQVDSLNKEMDEQKTALEGSVEEAKNEAIAASEQGDADTIDTAKNFTKEQDQALKSELKDQIQKAAKNAEEFAKSESRKLRKDINQLDKKANQLAKTDSKIQDQLAAGMKLLEETRELAKKPEVVTVYFASGKDSLSADAKETLDTAIRMIKGKGADWTVKVVGHADTRPVLSGKYRTNWDLSYARAVSAKDYLVENGVSNKIEVIARGHTEPATSPDSRTGQKENRRVEVMLCAPGK